MAMTRLVLKHLQHQRVIPPPNPAAAAAALAPFSSGKLQKAELGSYEWGTKGFSSAAVSSSDAKPSEDSREVSVSEGGKGSRLSPRRRNRRGLWRNRDTPLFSPLNDIFNSGLGSALMQATDNMNRLFGNLMPSRLMGQVREKDEYYKLRYEVPGLSKEDVKITVENGVLKINGEHKEEKEEEGSEDEQWCSASYGYYNASLMLPEDAKADEIKAELKDGVLYVTVPRSQKQKKDVTEVQIQ